MNKKLLVAGLIFTVIGAGIAILGFMPQNTERQANVDNWNRLNGGAGSETEAVIVNTSTQLLTEGARRNRTINTVYCAVYEYTVAGSTKTVTAVGDDCKETADEVVKGETGTVIYDEADPTIAFVKSDASDAFYKDTNGSQIVAVVLGLAMLIIGVLSLFAARPKTPEQLAALQEKRRKADAELAKLVADAEADAKATTNK